MYALKTLLTTRKKLKKKKIVFSQSIIKERKSKRCPPTTNFVDCGKLNKLI